MQTLDGSLVSALGQFNNDRGQIDNHEPKVSALFALDDYCIARVY